MSVRNVICFWCERERRKWYVHTSTHIFIVSYRHTHTLIHMLTHYDRKNHTCIVSWSIFMQSIMGLEMQTLKNSKFYSSDSYLVRQPFLHCFFFSEWLVHQHRDSIASYIGHHHLIRYFSLVENESIGRYKFNLLEASLSCKGLTRHSFIIFRSITSFLLIIENDTSLWQPSSISQGRNGKLIK